MRKAPHSCTPEPGDIATAVHRRRWLVPELFLLLSSTVCAPTGASAASVQREFAEIGVYFDPGATVSTLQLAPGEVHTFYVAARVPTCGIYGTEFSLALDSALEVVDVRLGDPSWFDVAAGRDNWLIGLAGILPPGGDPIVFVEYDIRVAQSGGTDLLICLGPSVPSSLPGSGLPAWAPAPPCDEIRPFALAQRDPAGHYPPGCAVVNPTLTPPIPGQRDSWGTVKGLYR